MHSSEKHDVLERHLSDAFARPFGNEPFVADNDSILRQKLEAAPPSSSPSKGTASVGRAVFLLIKAFVGTGILFLPRAFHNGGMIFSIAVMLLVAGLSLWSYLLLVRAREHCPGGGSFGDIAEHTCGRIVRFLVQSSIALSQLGFVAAYCVFVAENLQSFIVSVSKCALMPSVTALIFIQMAIYVPLALIRRIERLGFVTIIAEAFILFGLAYIYFYDFKVLAARGISSSITLFNPDSFPLFIGTAVYSFEGIGLVIPITESMREPQKFPRVLWITLTLVTFLFVSVGALSYAAFGADIRAMVTMNLPQDNPIVSAIQVIYALAIVFSVPLQLFPAITILEDGIFGLTRSGSASFKWKWAKNVFRTLLVLLCAIIAWVGSNDLDKFVSLIGSFACIPLCFIYPPLFHWKSGAVRGASWKKIADWLLIVFGTGVMVFATYITVNQWAVGGGDTSHNQCATH